MADRRSKTIGSILRSHLHQKVPLRSSTKISFASVTFVSRADLTYSNCMHSIEIAKLIFRFTHNWLQTLVFVTQLTTSMPVYAASRLNAQSSPALSSATVVPGGSATLMVSLIGPQTVLPHSYNRQLASSRTWPMSRNSVEGMADYGVPTALGELSWSLPSKTMRLAQNFNLFLAVPALRTGCGV